jgi:hypothetical protein
VRVLVEDIEGITAPSTARTPAADLESVVSEAFPNSILPVVVAVVKVPTAGVVAPTVPLIFIEAVPVKLVTVPLAGVPRIGPVIVGLVRVLLVKVWLAVRVTTVSVVEGNVIVVPSVPDKVRVLVAERIFPSVILTPTYMADHEAAVVPEVKIQVTMHLVPPAKILTVFPPEERTVTRPVELFLI